MSDQHATPKPRKPRQKRHEPKDRDGLKLKQLPPDIQEQIEALALDEAPLRKIQAICKKHGVAWSLGRISVFGSKRRERHKQLLANIAARKEMIAAFKSFVKETGATISEAALNEAAADYADLLDASINPNDAEAAKARDNAVKRLIGIRGTEIRQHNAVISERKVAVLEKKLVEVKQVAESKLTAEEQRARLKEILK